MYGVIGEKLGHSFSKEIHESFNLYKYDLIELKKEELPSFFKDKAFDGINVTVPYKQEVIKYLDEISPTALKINAVNTIVKHHDKLYGYNTDYAGVCTMLRYYNIDLKNKKILILGTGGTSNTVEYVCKELNPKSITKVSRYKNKGNITYEELSNYCDTDILINTTPCGMYPNDDSPVDLDVFKNLEVIIDVVYNPLNTKLVRMARNKGIRAYNGLLMLVSQAVHACFLFKSKEYDSYNESIRIYKELLKNKTNLVLVGMPGSGKTTLGKIVAKKLNKEFIDTDSLIEKEKGLKIEEFLNKDTEKEFRSLEEKVIKDISFKTNSVIATGGGVILNKDNIDYLNRNGVIIFIDRDINSLSFNKERPLSKTKNDLIKLGEARYDLYKKYSFKTIKNDSNIDETVLKIMEAYDEVFSN